MGTENSIQTTRIFKEVTLLLPKVDIVEDFFFLSLELGSASVILGMQWLEKLGTTQVNWTTLLIFNVGDKPITLRGEVKLCKMQVSLKSLMHVSYKEG